jgi:MFS family permease
MISLLAHGLIVSTWVSRIASVKSSLHLGDGALGLALLGTAIGSVAAIPVCGVLVARYGSRTAVRWTGLGFAIALALPAFAVNWVTLFLSLLIYGGLAGANDVAMNAQAVATEKLLGTPAMSRFHAMFSVGGIVGSALGGLIAGQGVSPSGHLVTGAALFAAIALFAPTLMIDTHDSGQSRAHGRLRRIPPALVALSVIGFCIFLSEGAIADWTGVYLRQVIGADVGVAPLGYAVFSAAMAIFRLAGDAIVLKIGRAATIRFGGLIAAAGMLIAVLAHSTGWALAGFAAAGAGFSSIIPLVFAAGGRIEGVAEGVGVATVSGIGYLGFLAGPPAIGLISEVASLRAGLFLLVILSLTASLLVRVSERNLEASEALPVSPVSDLP